MGEKAGMELRRLKKVALNAGPTVSHHCPMQGMYRMLGEVRLASTKTCSPQNTGLFMHSGREHTFLDSIMKSSMYVKKTTLN